MNVSATAARVAQQLPAARIAAIDVEADARESGAAPSGTSGGSNSRLVALEAIARRFHAASSAGQQAQAVHTDADAMAPPELVVAFQERFAALAGDPEAFHALLRQSFGDAYDVGAAEAIRQRTLAGDFGWMPRIEMVDPSVLNDVSGTQGAGAGLGAYDAGGDRILLSRDLVEGDPDLALDILTEEIGHALDTRLNAHDSAGDEGAVFARLSAGEALSRAELEALRAEDDGGTLLVDGQRVEVEFGWLSDAWDSATDFVSDTVDSVTDFVGDAVDSVGDFVSDTVQNIGDAIGDGVDFVNESIVSPVLNAIPGGSFVYDHLVQPGFDLLNGAIDIGTNAIDTLVDTTTHALSGVVHTTGNLLSGNWSEAWSSFTGIGTTFFQDIGGGIVENLAIGAHSLASAANGLFGLSETRGLRPEEEAYLRTIYGDSVDYSEIRLQQGGLENMVGMDPHAIGGDIFMPDWAFAPDGSLTPRGLELLSHEVGHTWQSQTDGAGYISDAIISYIDDRPAAYDYGAAIDGLIPWEDLTPDQQAELARIIGMAIAINGTGTFEEENIEDAILNDNNASHAPSNPIGEAELDYLLEVHRILQSGDA